MTESPEWSVSLVTFKSSPKHIQRSFGQRTTYSLIMMSFFFVLVAVFAIALIGTFWFSPQNGNDFVEEVPSPSDTSPLTAGQTMEDKGAQVEPEVQPGQNERGGWQIEDGERYYYQADGTKATGTILINGAFVHFDEQGQWQSTRLDVPYISQLPDMPSGCEVVSVTMMLNYAGIDVTKEDVAERLPYADDPEFGFTGSLYDDGYYWEGGIIWPPALLDLVESYIGTAVDLTESPWSVICEQIDAGRPVCIWFGTDGLDHTVLLTGYSATEIWLNDPLDEENSVMSLEWFMFYWQQNDYRALSY